MRRIFDILLIFVSLSLAISCRSDNTGGGETPVHSAVMLGASIASPDNVWFELGCETCGVEYTNLAVSATSIRDTAAEFHDAKLFSTVDHNEFDILVLDHVHNQNVCDESMFLENYTDYVISETMDYTQAFDYVIRCYMDQCASLEFDPKSKWYGVNGGKPVHIILCSYWHDARVEYNESARRLAERWSKAITFCPIDRKIGFSRLYPDATTGEQISIMYCKNGYGETEVIDGVTYGWHPTHGRRAAIQIMMADIFAETLGKVLEEIE